VAGSEATSSRSGHSSPPFWKESYNRLKPFYPRGVNTDVLGVEMQPGPTHKESPYA